MNDSGLAPQAVSASSADAPVERAELVHRATASVKWTTLASLLPRALSPLSTLLLAALLAPADFGTVAIATSIITFAQVVVGLGVGPAVVHCRARLQETATAAFWMTLAVAGILYTALWLAAPTVATVYQVAGLDGILRVAGLTLAAFALGCVPSALLQRELGFRKLFWVTTLPPMISIPTSVVLALMGAGVWALVIGPLAGAVAHALLAWYAARWRPALGIDRAAARLLLGFGVWVLVAGFQSWLFLYADNAIAGYFLGAGALGVYSLGFNISNLLPGLVIPNLSAVAYPAFCALQANREEVASDLLKLQALAAAVVFPVAFGLSAVAAPAVTLLYGAKWDGLGMVIALLAIMPGLSHLWSLNSDVYRAIGRPDVWTKVAGAALLVLMPLLWLSGPFGLAAFTLARFGGAFLLPLLNILATARVLGVSVRRQLRAMLTPFLSAGVMAALVRLLIGLWAPFAGGTGWAKLLIICACGACVYALVLWRIDRQLWNKLWLAARQVVRRA